MELVYLWIEDYKNIQNQGFSFSPRFECDFDEEKKELTIKENKEYNSIFPNNINITAIVGENGSGKSSVLEYLFDTKNTIVQDGYELANKSKYLICYFNSKDNNIYYKSNKIIDSNFQKSDKFKKITTNPSLSICHINKNDDFNINNNIIFSNNNYKNVLKK